MVLYKSMSRVLWMVTKNREYLATYQHAGLRQPADPPQSTGTHRLTTAAQTGTQRQSKSTKRGSVTRARRLASQMPGQPHAREQS